VSLENIERIKELYAKVKNLKLVSEALSIPWQTVYWWLKKEGVQVVGDKARYGGDSDSVGIIGELLFKRLFPDAVYENDTKYQAKHDFTLHGLKIDIKTSSLRSVKTRKGNIATRWGFNCYNAAEHGIDFFVCFCLNANGRDVDKILLIPSEMVVSETGGVSVSSNRSKWDAFVITEQDIVEFFNNFKAS